MSTRPSRDAALDDVIRELQVLLPRLVARAKRIPPPPELHNLPLGPRHLSLLSILLLDGPMTVNEAATHLHIAPTTASLLISDLTRAAILHRTEDEADRRRRIISITPQAHPAIASWLAPGTQAWRHALAPLSHRDRRLVVDTLLAYEAAVAELRDGDSAT
ncbi:MAG: winged helix-turn-helix transcriptional regulator [Catenulispora sp.]|nr:winged helix-turn-helix transcriptional regulator [Catenulispora sp.]